MITPRFFINSPLKEGETLTLKEERHHYIVRVLRLKEGETLTLFNGKGGEYQAEISALNKKTAEIQIITYSPLNRGSSLKLHLYQGMAKGDKMDLVLQKCTELGLSSFTPLISQRSIFTLKSQQLTKRYERWQTILQASCEQCGRNYLPYLNQPISLEALLESFNKISYPLIFLAPSATYPLAKVITEIGQANKEIGIIIGPEGGLSPKEIAALKEQRALEAHLGERVLRTETAALSVISSLHALIGDWCISKS